jgi:hypothetical protein
MAGMFESARRPLKPAESRFLQAKIKNLLGHGRRTSKLYLPITAAITSSCGLSRSSSPMRHGS